MNSSSLQFGALLPSILAASLGFTVGWWRSTGKHETAESSAERAAVSAVVETQRPQTPDKVDAPSA